MSKSLFERKKNLQHIINVLHQEAADINMSCNVKKTVCMVFSPKCRRKVIRQSFPVFKLGDSDLQFVNSFKYLGHIICHSFSDDDDVKREIRNMYTRTNILIRKYSRCSLCVKLVLFKSYCICMYDTALGKLTVLECTISSDRAIINALKWFWATNGYIQCYTDVK